MIVDHCNGILYTNQIVAQASYFSVSLFVLLSGLVIWISDADFKRSLRKAGILYLQYAFATFLLTFHYEGFFDIKSYLSYLLSFSVCAPYYFFVFFIQLVFISPMLLAWCKYCKKHAYSFVWHSATVAVLGILSAICIQYTYVLPVHGGGQFLFGGTYILVFYLGILLGAADFFKGKKDVKVVKAFGLFVLWGSWLVGDYRNKFPFDQWLTPYWGAGLNPPGINLIVFAVITLFLLYELFSTLEESSVKIVQRIICVFSWIGKNTLYIFMYHLLVRDMVLPRAQAMNIWFMRILMLILMIFAPVVTVEILRKMKRKVCDG